MSLMIARLTRKHSDAVAFTLVEALVTLIIAVVMVVGIIRLLTFNFVYQNQQELRAGAMDAMVGEMEMIRHEFIYRLEPYDKSVTVSDNRTPSDITDDSRGDLRVRLFDRAGNELTDKASVEVATKDGDRLRVAMMVEWRGRGIFSRRLYREQLVGYLIP